MIVDAHRVTDKFLFQTLSQMNIGLRKRERFSLFDKFVSTSRHLKIFLITYFMYSVTAV